MLKIYGVPSRDFVRWISEIIIGKNLDKWVDLGCGNGNYLQSLKITFKQGIAVDTAEKIPNLPNNFIYENCFVDEWLKKNKIANFDLISMFDLVEHFPKEEALVLINKAKNLTNNLLITTPLGFLKQDAATHPEFANNPYLWHRSGFSPEDFERNGFLVFALRNYHYKPIGNNKSFAFPLLIFPAVTIDWYFVFTNSHT